MRKGEAKRGSKGGFSAPDVVLAAQFFTDLRGRAAAEGERLLMVAVLEDAAHCFRKHLFAIDRRSQSLFEEAEEWLMEEDTGAAFSFRHICESLDLEPRYIRLALRKWQEQQLEAQRTALPPSQLPAAAEWSADLPEPLQKVSGQ